ncbi:MAG: PepSY domain-containing protein [Alcanivorax sp.]|nr:PepSY domain-containing protein [Alcanivorax sp.]
MALLMALTLPLTARADTLPVATFKSMIAHADDYGFSHYTEIEVEDDGAIEVEGWISEGWQAKVDFAADGTPVREERQQKNDGPRGITLDQLHAAIDTATNEGMARIEQVDVDRRNVIEVEGKDAEGQDLEIRINADTGEVTGVERG